ncbi:MAG: S49 family peptidase, partial [Planctomycetota bacterium]
MKKLIRNIVATLIGLVIFSALLLMVLAGMTREKISAVPDKAMLVLDLSVPISDKPLATTPRGIVDEMIYGTPMQSTPLFDLTQALESAAKDPRILGLYLHGNVASSGLMSGWAALKEVRKALLSFKAGGKKIYACCSNYGEKDLYLASMADPVCVDTLGNVEIDGFASQSMYFARAFQKYGIGIQVTRVGKYKSAVEPFLLEKMSPENREQIENYLGDLYDIFLQGVAESRKIEINTLKSYANEKILFEGKDAVEAGLVDRAVYFDEVFEELKTLTGVKEADDSFAQISLSDYIKVVKDGDDRSKKGGKIAVIYAEGDIVDGDDDAQV